MSCPDSVIRFVRTSDEEAQILAGNDYVGDVFAYDDTLGGGARIFEIHLFDDWRGPCRVRDRSRVRETAQRMVDTLPWR